MAAFAPGDRVRVREDYPPGHIRTPVYVRGREGVVQRKFGTFPNPEILAIGRDGMPAKALYEVRFRQKDLWPDYSGSDADTLDIDIYEHWLAKNLMVSAMQELTDHHGEAEHAHPHAPPAKDEKIHSYFQVLGLAIKELLVEKGIVTPEEIRKTIEFRDSITPAMGAKIVARAWTDPAYKQRLLRSGTEAIREFGLDMGSTELVVVENTPAVHNMIVCTLCSCYPRAVLGLPPSWYKSREYRSRTVREPRAVLREFGTEIPASVEVRVHDSTADMRYLVLPMRPQGTEKLDAERLAGLVTRDCMIGVALPRSH